MFNLFTINNYKKRDSIFCKNIVIISMFYYVIIGNSLDGKN